MTAPSLILAAALVAAVARLAAARLSIGEVPRARHAEARGSAAAGVRYAFTAAFLPWAKESASRHLFAYLAGVVYHAGIFAMLASLVLTLVVPGGGPAGPLRYVLAALGSAALASGLGLCAKRSLDPTLRAISVPDDWVSNLLVDAALAGAVAASLAPALLPAFQLAGAALLLYAPVGKLRHMIFLFTSRRLWGVHYGRRGVLP